jgi:hypothetical protein
VEEEGLIVAFVALDELTRVRGLLKGLLALHSVVEVGWDYTYYSS